MPPDRFAPGARAGLPFAFAAGLLAVSFGAVARGAGWSLLEATAMSAIVFSGAAQFAALGIVTAGGGAVAALAAAGLANARYLIMGLALAPSLRGGPLRRLLLGQPVVDSSWAMAMREDGSFALRYMTAHTGVQYAGWIAGTVGGFLAGTAIGDPRQLGLDAIFPAFFVAILLGERRHRSASLVALAGGAVALALVPLTAPGVPVLAAGLVALVGLHPRTGA